MYEDKTRRKIQINWKSLLIKLGILLVVVFVVLWIISLFKKDEVTSNFGTNLQSMRDAATEYFTASRLPKEEDESVRLTLKEMFDRNLLIEFQDEFGNSCDVDNSYIEATKLDEENYRIEVKLICDNDSDTIINTVKYQSQEDDTEDLEEQPILDDNTDDENTSDTTQNNNSSNNTSSNNTSRNNNPSSKPNSNVSNNTTTKPNNNTSSNTTSKPNNNTSSNNSSSKPNNDTGSDNSSSSKPITQVCTYGKKEYVSLNPLAYVVSGDCAVGSLYTYANEANDIYLAEYQKLVQEMNQLNSNIVVKTHDGELNYITPVMNKEQTGYVGYQMYFQAVIKSGYTEKTIYAYYLDQNGNRKVVIDRRGELA